jgi:tetratricopeptide (TPR) repeat protein
MRVTCIPGGVSPPCGARHRAWYRALVAHVGAPASRRRVVPARVAAAAVAALFLAGFLVLATRRDGTNAASATGDTVVAALPGQPPVVLADPAKDPLGNGAALLAKGDAAGAQRAFRALQASGDPRVAVALAVAQWSRNDLAGSIARIARLANARDATPFARYEHGVVLTWSGKLSEATRVLRPVAIAYPDDFYGVKADDLLHPSIRPGYPPYVPSAPPPKGATLTTLAEAATARPGDAMAELQLGSALGAPDVGQRRAALAAFRRALADAPSSIEARVAVAVGGFSKDDPSQAFGVVGPLVQANPTDPVPRFHLGLMLLWIGQRQQAQAQFAQTARSAPTGRLGRLAAEFARDLQAAS